MEKMIGNFRTRVFEFLNYQSLLETSSNFYAGQSGNLKIILKFILKFATFQDVFSPKLISKTK